jgi:hypothetical protein
MHLYYNSERHYSYILEILSVAKFSDDTLNLSFWLILFCGMFKCHFSVYYNMLDFRTIIRNITFQQAVTDSL